MRALVIVGAVLVGIPALLAGYLVYSYWSPHLLINPINRALYMASIDSGRGQTKLSLSPRPLVDGLSFSQAEDRLYDAGYRRMDWFDAKDNGHSFEQELDTKDVTGRFRYVRGARGLAHELCGQEFIVTLTVDTGILKSAEGVTWWVCA